MLLQENPLNSLSLFLHPWNEDNNNYLIQLFWGLDDDVDIAGWISSPSVSEADIYLGKNKSEQWEAPFSQQDTGDMLVGGLTVAAHNKPVTSLN